MHGFYSFLFPVGERRVEAYDVVLEDAKGEGTDCVGGCNAAAIIGCDSHRLRGGIVDAGYVCREEKTGVVGGEEGGGFALDKGIETAGVEDVVVLVAELVEGCVVILTQSLADFKIVVFETYDHGPRFRALVWTVTVFPIELPPFCSLLEHVLLGLPICKGESDSH